jgi:adenosylhomocysteine nucleosidase
VAVATGLVREARIALGPGARAVAGGGEGKKLAAALKQMANEGALGLVSFGIAGATDPELPAGRVVIATEVIQGAVHWVPDPAWAAALLGAIPGSDEVRMMGSDHAVTELAQKRLFWQRGASAVDMETHIVARTAAELGLPFAVMRVIADPADRALPPAARVGLGSDGRADIAAVLRSLLSDPAQLPALLATALEVEAAFRALKFARRRLHAPGFCFPELKQTARAA